MRIQVKDFMSSPVTTAVGKTSIKEIRTLMKRHNIHAIPIIRYSKQLPEVEVVIRGIISTTDLCTQIDDKTYVEEIMTNKVHIIHKDSNAHSAANMMLKHNVHHLVLMDEGKIIGMISSLDFVKLVADHSLV